MLALLFLNSCVSNNDEKLPFVTLDGAENMLISEYRIVVSRLSSGEVIEAVRGLCADIEEHTGVASVLSYDDELSYISDGTWVIYVGNVDVLLVRDLIGNMRTDDYMCRSYDKETVIGGRSDSATLQAILRFTKEILPVSDNRHLIPTGGGFEHRGVYSIEKLYIGNASVRDFEIVTDSLFDTEAINTAYSLRRKISDSFGYWLNVRIGSRSETGRGIYVTRDEKCENGRAELSCSENGVILRAKDGQGLEKISDTFMDLLMSDADTDIQNPHIPDSLYVPYGETKCALALSLFSYLPIYGSMEENTLFKDTVYRYSPDVLLGGGVIKENGNIISNLLDSYRCLVQDGGIALSSEKASVEKQKTELRDGVMCEVYCVKSGTLEFLLVYISGRAEEPIDLELEALVGNTPIPVIAVSYTEKGEGVTVTSSEQQYFEKVIDVACGSYKNAFSFVCYTDVSRLLVTDSGECDIYGIKRLTVAVR